MIQVQRVQKQTKQMKNLTVQNMENAKTKWSQKCSILVHLTLFYINDQNTKTTKIKNKGNAFSNKINNNINNINYFVKSFYFCVH